MTSNVGRFIRLQHMAQKAAEMKPSPTGAIEHARSFNRLRDSVYSSIPEELQEEFASLFPPLEVPDRINLQGPGLFTAGGLSDNALQGFSSLSGWLEGLVAAEQLDQM